MTILNERNNKTKKVIHLLTTTLCNRNCPYCCNKQYDLNSIPYVTDEELREAEIICITGGEPVLYSNPPIIADYLKHNYSNIKSVYVYANARELETYINRNDEMTNWFIDGYTVSIKDIGDVYSFERIAEMECLKYMESNVLYIFKGDYRDPKVFSNFKVIRREWQEDFKPADDSIFRKI